MSVQVLGQRVGPIGFGLMGFTWRPDPPPLEQAIETLKAALDNGCNFWNGGEFYGTPEYNSMTLLRHYFTRYPEDADKVTLIIKGGVNSKTGKPDGSAECTRDSMENMLKQLGGTKKIDAWGYARRDASTPLEVTFGVLKEYIDSGKLGGIAMSECRADTIHEAAKHAKIVAAELELSMFSPDILKNGVAAACAEHDIPIVAYSPIGRGMLTGRFTDHEKTKEIAMLSRFPRFQPDAFEHNLGLVRQVQALAEKKGCTPAQLAIAWVCKMSGRPGMPTVVPIPGATTVARVEENSKVVDLSEEEFSALNEIVDNFKPAGERYPAAAPTNT